MDLVEIFVVVFIEVTCNENFHFLFRRANKFQIRLLKVEKF